MIIEDIMMEDISKEIEDHIIEMIIKKDKEDKEPKESLLREIKIEKEDLKIKIENHIKVTIKEVDMKVNKEDLNKITMKVEKKKNNMIIEDNIRHKMNIGNHNNNKGMIMVMNKEEQKMTLNILEHLKMILSKRNIATIIIDTITTEMIEMRLELKEMQMEVTELEGDQEMTEMVIDKEVEIEEVTEEVTKIKKEVKIEKEENTDQEGVIEEVTEAIIKIEVAEKSGLVDRKSSLKNNTTIVNRIPAS